MLTAVLLQTLVVAAHALAPQVSPPAGPDQVAILVTVSLPESDRPGSVPADLQIHAASIDLLRAHSLISIIGGPPRFPASPPRQPQSGTARFVVRRNGPVGVTVFSPKHGLVEVAIAEEVLRTHRASSPLAVPIVLPPRRAPGKVRVDLTFGYERGEGAHEPIRICSALTGVQLFRRRLPLGESSTEFELPPGEYRVHMVPSVRSPFACYGTPFEVPPAVDLRQRFVVDSARVAVVQHTFAPGTRFSLRVDVAGREVEIEAKLSATIRRTNNVFRLWPDFDEDDWVATASLLSVDGDTLPTARPVVTTWAPDHVVPRDQFPLGHSVETTNRLLPGKYLMTISGPRIETCTVPIEIEAHTDWRAPARVHRILVQPRP